MTIDSTDTTKWADGPLHAALVKVLPTFVKEPFAPSPRINIPKLKVAVGKSHEAVYQWLRANRVTPRNAKKLVELANTDENVAVLAQLGRRPPVIEDFQRFVFA